jgi:cold shock CspA family protein
MGDVMDAGIIDAWVVAKGFGFVKLRTGESTVAFLHISEIINPPKDDVPRPGDIVLFDLVKVYYFADFGEFGAV